MVTISKTETRTKIKGETESSAQKIIKIEETTTTDTTETRQDMAITTKAVMMGMPRLINRAS